MIKLIIYVVVALLALSFFGISLQKIVEGPTAQANFHFLFDLLLKGWYYILSYIEQTFSSIKTAL
jgi:hypothetical protein